MNLKKRFRNCLNFIRKYTQKQFSNKSEIKFKQLLMTFVAAVLGTAATNAQNSIGISDISIQKGEVKTIGIELANSTEYTALQMDISLGAGLCFVPNATDADSTAIDIALNSERASKSHTIAYSQLSGSAIRVISYSSGNAAYKGTSGAIIYFKITADSTAANDSEIRLSNIYLTTPAGKEDHISDFTAKARIQSSVSATVSCGYGGTAMLSKENAEIGEPLTLLTAPCDGYKVAHLILNGTQVEIKDNIYRIESLTGDAAFEVLFEKTAPDTVYITGVTEIPAPVIEFRNGLMSIKCQFQGARIYYTLDGTTEGAKEYTAPVAVDRNCTVTAYAILASKQAGYDIIITNIDSTSDEAVSRKYYTETGIETKELRSGVNIVTTTYASGRTETTKVVVSKK